LLSQKYEAHDRYVTYHIKSVTATLLLIISVLIVGGFIEQSIQYASGSVRKETAAAATTVITTTTTTTADANYIISKISKDCKANNNDDNSEVCLDSKSKDSVISPVSSSSNDTNLMSDNKDENDKKHKDPFLLPFP
jgi:hypothetical protein